MTPPIPRPQGFPPARRELAPMWHLLQYVATQLQIGLHVMAARDTPLRDRIVDAFDEFHPVFVFGEHLPEPLKTTLTRLHARVTGAEGVEATLQALSDREIQRVARAIVDADTDAQAVLHESERAAGEKASEQ